MMHKNLFKHHNKICLVTSKGGHLYQLMQIKDLWKSYDRCWITFPGADTTYYLKDQKKYFAHYPESRNVVNFMRNFFLAFTILWKEKPDVLISCGAGIAVPFFIVGKLFFHAKLIFIEPYDFIAYPSFTGKIVYNFVDLFLVQHTIQQQWFPKAHYWGSLL